MSVDTSRNEDFNLRLDSATAALLERASSYIGLDKTKFIRESIREKARAIIEEREKTTFAENPPEPTEATKIALEAPKAVVVSQVNEQELLDHPLLQVSGLFAIDAPGWVDRHDKYLAEIYQEDNANDK